MCKISTFLRMLLTLSALNTKTDALSNSVDPDETAHNEPSHLDIHCLPMFLIYNCHPFDSNGYVQMQRWKSLFQKLRVERVD